MKKISKKEISIIRKKIGKEFPDDPALQEVHVARKILAKEAEANKMSYVEYIRSLNEKVKEG